MAREIPFHMRPLWTAAAVSSQQDVLEASHCAALTASLRQLAGVVQHAGAAFEQLHDQTGKLTSRCQQAEARCLAVQHKLAAGTGHSIQQTQGVSPQSTATNDTKILQGLDVLPSTVQASMSGIHMPAASPSEVLIKAQYPSVHASPSLPQQATADSTQLISQQLSAPTGQTAAWSGEAAVELPHQQSNTILETVSLSEEPEAVQLAMHSAPVLAQPALTPETGTSAVNAEAASQRAEESNASVRDIAQGDMLESHSTAVVQPTSLVGPNISTELSDHPLLSQPIQTGSVQLSAASDMQNHLTGSPAHSTKAPALQEEHSSMSGFHTPSSQPVSRVQSATSSDAFVDSSSQLTSRTASITSSASTAVSSLNSLASSRRPVPGTRQSTRDLIGALRQQAGLPPPDAFLSPPDDQEKTVVLPAIQQSLVADNSAVASLPVVLVESQLQPVALMPQTPSTVSAEGLTLAVPVAGGVTGQTASTQGTSGVTAQDRQSVVLQTETSGASGSSTQTGQPQPSVSLLELVSNPLYAKSFDATRGASPLATHGSQAVSQSSEYQATQATQSQAEPLDSQQQSIAQPNIASSAGSAAAVETAVHGSNQQSASLAAAIAEGTVVQESSQPILSGLVTDTEALIDSNISAAQVASIQEVDVSEAPSARVVLSESPIPDVSGDGSVTTEQLTSVSEASASDTAVTKALASDAAPALVLVSESASPVVQISDEPILTESQAAAPAVQGQQAFSHDSAMVSSTEFTEQSAEHISLSPTLTSAASPEPAAVGLTEAVALSEDPILDPAADDVNTVRFPMQQTVVDSPAQSVLVTSAQQQTGLAELPLASHTHLLQPAIPAPEMQPPPTVTEQPLLPPVHASPQVTSQVVLTEQHRFTSAAYSAHSSSQAVVTGQPPMTAVLQRPPVPALPSKLRRSRSDLPIGQQLSSGSLLSQQSLAQMESQAGMRRSISNIQAVSSQPAVQTGLSQSLAYMPATMQAVEIRQTASPLKAAVPAIPAIPVAPAKPMPVQPVQIVNRTMQQAQPTVVQTAVVQQALSASIDNRELMMQGAAPKGPVFMRSYGSSAALRPQTPLAVIQEQAAQLPVSAQQTVFVASAPQQLAPYPVALGSPPSQPPQFMRTAAVPASVSFQPMTSTVSVDTQGPLSKGVQESWNSIPTSVLQQQQQQPPPLTVPQTASSWHQGTLHAPVVASPSQHFMPLSVSYDSLQTPVLPRVATPVLNTARSFQQPATGTMQTPAMYDMQQATYAMQPQIPSTSMAYAVSQGPLRQSMPLAPPQQPSIASMQYVQSPGTVIQPMSSTTIVGPPNQETQRLAQSGAGFSIVPLHQAGQQRGLQQQSLQQQIMAKPALARSQTGGVHASRALQAFSRSRSSFGSGEVPLGDGYLVQQGAFPSEPQPAERAESPPTPVAPPASYFHSREPLQSMATSHITVSAAPPLPPAPAPVLSVGPAPGQQIFGGFAPARASRAPAFPAHLRPAVASLQAQAPTPISYQSAQLFANQPQQAPPSIGSQGSGQGRFQFQPLGQPMSPSSNSTPSLSGRSVKAMPAFLEEAWARGEPGPSNARPSPPPLPDSFVSNMQGGPRHSLAANAMAGWASSDVAATHQRSGTTIINGGKDEPAAGQNSREVKQGTAAAQPGLPNEVSLYQSPMSHHSVSSFGGGSPSPQPAARGTPKQATPATPQPIQAAAGGAPDLLQSIRNGQYHLRKMSFSYQPKGMARADEGGQDAATTPLAAMTAGSSGLPPAGGNRTRRRNSGSTTGMEAIMKRTQAIRNSVYPESTAADSDSDWEE